MYYFYILIVESSRVMNKINEIFATTIEKQVVEVFIRQNSLVEAPAFL